MRDLLTLPDLAAHLRVTPGWLSRRLSRLCAERGFPRPLAALRPQLRWDPRAVEDWEAAQRNAAPRIAVDLRPPAPANDTDAEDTYAAQLDDRAAELAGRHAASS